MNWTCDTNLHHVCMHISILIFYIDFCDTNSHCRFYEVKKIYIVTSLVWIGLLILIYMTSACIYVYKKPSA